MEDAPRTARTAQGRAAQPRVPSIPASIVETSSHGIIGFALDGTITTWSLSAARAYGFAAEEIVGRPLEAIVPFGDAAEQIANLRQVAEGRVLEAAVDRIKKDGTRFRVDVLITPVFASDGMPAETDEDEEEPADLRRVVGIAEARARLIAENATDLISTHSPDGIYTYASPSCKRLLGYEPADLIGHSAYEFFHPEDLAAITESHSQILELPVVWTVEYRMRRRDGTYVWFETTSRTIRDDGGTVLEIVAFSRDISERKARELSSEALAAEQRALAAKFEELNRMKGEFLAMTAHDLRSPMTAISGFTELLLGKWAALNDEQKQDYLQTIARSTTGARALVDDLLDIGKIESGALALSPADVDVAACARLVADEANVGAEGERVTVEAREGVRARADEQRLLQVLRNLVGNAVKFSDAGTPVVVRVGLDGDAVRIEVADRGVGIEPEHLASLFQPFVRVGASSAQAPGTGLGLYICRKLVEAMDGTIDVQSEPGAGTTFRVTLPRA